MVGALDGDRPDPALPPVFGEGHDPWLPPLPRNPSQASVTWRRSSEPTLDILDWRGVVVAGSIRVSNICTSFCQTSTNNTKFAKLKI